MKQVFQNISNGDTFLLDAPTPKLKSGHVLIASKYSLLSPGTEKMLVNFGKSNIFNKAKQQPDKVKEVLNKISTDGVLPTLDAVRAKLGEPIPLGYSNVGIVLESDVEEFSVGDRVVSNGAHADIIMVPKNLCAKIPEVVADEEAVFTVLASIALQGVRLAEPTIGETFVVYGLGLIGLIAVQLLVANGCQVIAIDLQAGRCALAKEFGAKSIDIGKGEDAINAVNALTHSKGADGVLIAASASGDEIVHQSATMLRQRGRMILVGVVDLSLRRDDFYKKELTFQVSSSYGPGRYDTRYEEGGEDYPFGYVRWTEKRNFESILGLMASGKLSMAPLVSKQFPFEQSVSAYESLTDPSVLGILFFYGDRTAQAVDSTLLEFDPLAHKVASEEKDGVVVAFIGAGNYVSRVLLPIFSKENLRLDLLVTNGGVSGALAGKKYGFSRTSTDEEFIWRDGNINVVVVASTHEVHAAQVVKALRTKKHVFVEKPLALSLESLRSIETTMRDAEEGEDNEMPILMIGFNRRFCPHVVRMKELLTTVNDPMNIVITVNAGMISQEHWIHNPNIGGGRLIGEGCHFIDLMRFLTGSSIESFSISSMIDSSQQFTRDENFSLNLQFKDGSLGVLNYFANGEKSYPKENIEVFLWWENPLVRKF